MEINGDLIATGMRFAIVASRFNALVTNELVGGAADCLVRHGARAEDIVTVRVPGGWEIPLAVKRILERGEVDAVIALGCVMTGQTTHNEHINNEVSKGLGALMLQYNKPVTFGVLSPATLEQALDRAGMKMGNKGAECAMAAIEMVSLLKKL